MHAHESAHSPNASRRPRDRRASEATNGAGGEHVARARRNSAPGAAGEDAAGLGQDEAQGKARGMAEAADAVLERCYALQRRSRALMERSRALLVGGSLRQERGRGRLKHAYVHRPMDRSTWKPAPDAVMGRLIVAQEEERRHIALELHDAVGQRVAATCISLRRLQRRLHDDAASQQLEEVLGVLGELAHGVRHLAHAMHPPLLELVGLEAALRSHCHELRTLAHFEVEMTADELPPISQDAALCLYRVAQEALANVRAHAGVMRAALSVARQDGGVELVVSDAGAGFDPGAVTPGLGLVGMVERVRPLGGAVVVESRRGAGTVIRARIPLAGKPSVPREDVDAQP